LALFVGGPGQGRAGYVHFGEVLLIADPAAQVWLSPRPGEGSRAATATGLIDPQALVLVSNGKVYASEHSIRAVVTDSRGDIRTLHVPQNGFGVVNSKKAIVLAFPGNEAEGKESGAAAGPDAALGSATNGGAAFESARNGSAGASGGGGAAFESALGGSGGGGVSSGSGTLAGSASGGERGGQAVASPAPHSAAPLSGGGISTSHVGLAVTPSSFVPPGLAPGANTSAFVSDPGTGFGAAAALPFAVPADIAPPGGGGIGVPTQVATLATDPAGSRPTVSDGTEADAGSPLSGLLAGAMPGQQPGAAVAAVPPGGSDPLVLSDSGAGYHPTFPADGRGPDPALGSAWEGEGPADAGADGAGNGLFAADPVAPEPASLTLLTTGVLALLGYGWRQRREAD
jgi:hypothetical protein